MATIDEVLKDEQFINLILKTIVAIKPLVGLEFSEINGLFQNLGPKKHPKNSQWIDIIKRIHNDKESFLRNKQNLLDAADIYRYTTLNEKNNLINIKKSIDNWLSLNDYKKTFAPSNGIFGKYAFADQRVGKVPPEPNNEIEEKIYRALWRHFTLDVPLDDKYVKILQDVLNAGLYKDVIHAPPQSQVYRGMIVGGSYIRDLIGVSPNTDIKDIDSFNEVIFKPLANHNATSWTMSLSVAQNFADQAKNGFYGIVFFANTKNNTNNFITCPGGLYDVGKLNAYTGEDEVLGLGQINVSKVKWKKSK